ncbi:MAG: hypothetical protein IJH64_05320 [Oscillospiraceae bacterium]|nr:hypothetical protein [Oscillospiraceae bacterium]
MRNRRTQRKVRKFYGSEEKIDLVDHCGIKDPTPYEAVRNLIKQERAESARYRAMAVRARVAAATGERAAAL